MERGPTLPGVEADDEDRIVLHVDLDCFYAACERLREPDLEGEPVVVGMGYEPGDPDGAVATASYEAREHGVESAQAISTALDRLPRAAARDDGEERAASAADGDTDGDGSADDADDPVGYYRPVDMAYYESVAEDVKAILHDSAATVREVSIDEAYLDVTERTDWTVAEGYARHVKQRIEREVGLVASVGVAPTMHAAKVASDHDKPDGLVVVEPGEVASFLAPLPVEDLHGIGPVTARKLREHDVETVADLADADREWIRERWGERGLELHDRARGHDPRVVEPRGRPKSLSRESAFADPEDDSEQVRERIRALASAVADRARSKDAMYRTIGIKVVLPPYDVNTRERSLSGPVDDPELVERVALDLHEEFADERPRKVGVRVSNLQFGAADQSTLGGWDGDAEAAETTASEAPSDDSADLPDGSGDPSDDSAGPSGGSTDSTSASPDSTSDGGSTANQSGTDPAPGHVLGLDFGEESGRATDDSESAAPAPDQSSASPAPDQPDDASQPTAPADASASEETAGSASSGATTAESSGGVLDLDAAASDGSTAEPGADDPPSDSRSSTAPSSTESSSSESASSTDSSSSESASSASSRSSATGAGLDAGQASLGSIAEVADAPNAMRDAEDAGDGDETSGAGRGSRAPVGSDGSDATRDSADDSVGTSGRPDDLPAGQTTLFDFW